MYLKQKKKNQKKNQKKWWYYAIIFIKEKSRDINNDFFKTYFNFLAPIDLAKKKNSELVEEIKNKWSNLKDEIKTTSKEEIKNGKPDDILEIINEILDFNKEIQKQQGLGLKIITPHQMLSRLPITLAGDNSEKT